MIDVTISYVPIPNEEDSYRLDNIPANIQLALYKYDLYETNKDSILSDISTNASKIKVVHLPIDTMRIPFKKINQLIKDIHSKSGCVNFVVHPNRGINKFTNEFWSQNQHLMLCVETFAWRKNKVFRTPLEITELCLTYNNVWMTIDTCHIEDIWFDHKIMPYLLKFTKVIHLSNRAKGLGSHLPFNHPEGELKLVSFVRDLKHRYKWSGTIVLEYMKEYSHKLITNHNYVKTLLGKT
jgi:hypothetical protein